ncbi:MAG TPA: cell division protein ZipA C-terminal FtsZ-binding domain-containing protein [Gammaproteobacteria bacterium]|nr:cell division protein ZipA C-terminal FtsZ-binding domain-containing protein [Gammaproteobacteria bacterium]
MELRLILILIGAVIIAAIWLFSKQRAPAAHDRSVPRSAPTLGEESFPEDEFPSETVPGSSAKSAPVREQGEQLILALHVMPRTEAHFAGAALRKVFETCNLKFGRYHAFHRLEGGESVFSVANVVEPGTFDPGTLDANEYPGLTLFMLLPGPRGGVASYADMLATARQLAQALDGEVLDQERSTLTRQTARHIRERIITFETQRKLRRPS